MYIKPYTNLRIEGERIEIIVEGISVVGRIILRDRRNIGVELTHPYSGISEQSGCIPLLGLRVHNFLLKFDSTIFYNTDRQGVTT